MRIALIVNSFPKISETFILFRVVELSKRGYDISIFSHSESNERGFIQLDIFNNIKNVKLYGVLPKIKFSLIGFYYFIFKRKRAELNKYTLKGLFNLFFKLGVIGALEKYSIVHFEFSALAVNYLPEISILTQKTKTIISCVGSAELIVPFVEPLRKQNLLTVLNKVNLVHCVSSHIYFNLVNMGLDNKKYVIIEPAINLDIFNFNPIKRQPNELLRVLMVGRLEWVKGYELALLAIKKLRTKGISIELSIIGSGKEGNKLKFLCKILEIEDCVLFLGSMNSFQVKEILNKSHVFLLTSWSEGISNSVLEAKSAGVAVISTKAGGMNEVLFHKKTGYLVDLGDSNGIGEGIEFFYENEEIRLEIIENARKDAILNHSLKSQIDEFEDIYNNI